MQEKEFDIQPRPPEAPGIVLGDLLRWAPVLSQLIAAVTGGGKASFIVRALGRKRRVTVEDA